MTTADEMSSPSARGRLRSSVDRSSVGALILAASVPFVFLHERFQPDLSIAVGTTTVDVRLSDFALLAVLVAALVAAARFGLGRLRPGLTVWLPGAALLLWLGFETLRPVSTGDAQFDAHLVTAAKFGEYAALALAVPLLVRTTRDLTIALGGLVLWGVVAAAVALVQFFGLDIFDAWSAGARQPSFLGQQDLAALATISVAFGAAGIAVGKRRIPVGSLFAAALVAGVLAFVIGGSVAAAGGLVLGALALAIAARGRFHPSGRRLLALAAIVVVCVGGVFAVRGAAVSDFLRFVGLLGKEQPRRVETYAQRTVLAYIGLRIFEDHPIVGVGWQRSAEPAVFEPYLADAHKRFPHVVEEAFPSPAHAWGVQNLYVQLLADAGVVGLVLLVALGAGGLLLGWRTAAYASSSWAAGAGLLTLCALLTLAGEWASLGIVAGIPIQAATSLLLGIAAAGAATVEEEIAV